MRNEKGQFIKGHKIGMTGKEHSEETKKKIGIGNWKGGNPQCVDCGTQIWHGAIRCNPCNGKLRIGENHPNWKKDAVGYYTLHSWVRSSLGTPSKCEFCGKDGLKGHQIHWANKDGVYERKLDNWLRLCIQCHNTYDAKRRKQEYATVC